MPDFVNVKHLIAGTDLVDTIRRAGVKLTRRGSEFTGLCPFHAEESPSFTVFSKGSKWSYKCFGCGKHGDALKFVQEFYSLEFKDALKHLQGGAKVAASGLAQLPVGAGEADADKDADRAQERKREIAYETYQAGRHHDPMLAAYLTARGIKPERLGALPKGLRIHAALKHRSGHIGPAMLAPITDADGKFLAVHRTWLMPDGGGKAKIDGAKMVLGACTGGAIQLYPAGEDLMIAEGIETALSVRQAYPDQAVWAGVSLANLASIIIPFQVSRVVLLADNDMKEPKAGQADPRDQIRKASMAWKRQRPGLKVLVATALPGCDFNDMLKGENA